MSAAPITSTASARRNNTVTGNNTCVTRHPGHRARLGRSEPTPRTRRGRAHPRGASTPAQPEQSSCPPANRDSTRSRYASTVTNGCPPCIRHGPPAAVFPDLRREGRCPVQMPVRLTAPTTKIKSRGIPRRSSATPLTVRAPVVVIGQRRSKRPCPEWWSVRVVVGCQAVAVGEDHCLDSVAEFEFGQDPAEVGLDGGLADDERAGDLAV